MYENKINKIPRKVNKVDLGNYLLIKLQKLLLKIKASFFLVPKVFGNYGSFSWVSFMGILK